MQSDLKTPWMDAGLNLKDDEKLDLAKKLLPEKRKARKAVEQNLEQQADEQRITVSFGFQRSAFRPLYDQMIS